MGGNSGFDAKETDDEDPNRLEAVARMTWAWLHTIFDGTDSAWLDAVKALESKANSLGHVQAK